MSKSIKDLWGEAAKLNKQGKEVANAKATAAKLPFTLKDEFRQAQDPALDTAINDKTQQVMGGAIEGLNKFQNITNPFERRALAEKFQGGLSTGLNNLTDERTRRQGVYQDYIAKWTGLFGAEAARKQDMFNNSLATFDRESNLSNTEYSRKQSEAATAENTRRWEIENKRSAESHAKSMGAGGGGSAGQNKYQTRLEDLSAKVNKGQDTREEANAILDAEVKKGLYKGVTQNDPENINRLNPNGFEDRTTGARYQAEHDVKPTTAAEQNAQMDNGARSYYTYLIDNGFEDEAKKYAENFPQVLK